MTRLGKNYIIKMWIAVCGCWLLQQLLLVLSLPKNYSNYSIITLHSDSMGNSFDLVTFQTHNIKLQMSQCVIGRRRHKYAKLFFAKPVKSKLSSYSNNNKHRRCLSYKVNLVLRKSQPSSETSI